MRVLVMVAMIFLFWGMTFLGAYVLDKPPEMVGLCVAFAGLAILFADKAARAE